jgi:hypothetical protein
MPIFPKAASIYNFNRFVNKVSSGIQKPVKGALAAFSNSFMTALAAFGT